MSRKIIFDYGLIPTVCQDFGHYLYDKNISKQITLQSDYAQWRRTLFVRQGHDLYDVILVDSRLGVASLIDVMKWENGKFRMYISLDRLIRYCPKMMPYVVRMIARLALSTAKKTGLSRLVHTDYVYVASEKVYNDVRKRRGDVKNIHRIHAILNGYDILHPHDFHPNSKAEYGFPFRLEPQHTRQKLYDASLTRDISVMWQCGNMRRLMCHACGVRTWTDDRFLEVLPSMVSPSHVDIISKMIGLSRSGEEFYFPRSTPRRFPRFFSGDPNEWMFIDFETDLSHCIYMVGIFIPSQGYVCRWASDLNETAERLLIDDIYQVIRRHVDCGGSVVYYYAEDRFWRARCERHCITDPLYVNLFSDALDLQFLFQSAPLLIRDVFNFKLKSIAHALFERGYITIQQPSGCSDGAESIILAQNYFKNDKPAHIRNILEAYNTFDCQVLFHLVTFLRLQFTSA